VQCNALLLACSALSIWSAVHPLPHKDKAPKDQIIISQPAECEPWFLSNRTGAGNGRSPAAT
jgi:hypothetical protein